MSNPFDSAITELQEQIKPLMEQIKPVLDQIDFKKKLINQLCEAGGGQPMYPDVGADKGPAANLGPVRPDQYFGRPLATVVREILERRKNIGLGAIPLNELYDALKIGGYEFDNRDAIIAKRNVAITLSKNSTFMKVPSTGSWGLSDWYPGARRNKSATSAGASASVPAAAEEEDDDTSTTSADSGGAESAASDPQ